MSVSSFDSLAIASKLIRSFIRPRFRSYQYVLPCTLQLTPFVKMLLKPVKKSSSYNLMELGLHEALVNAVRHGNNGNPDKILRIRRIHTPNWFVWQIQDEGDGMPLDLRIFKLPFEIDAESGRGLYLIYQCFDDVRWSNKGNRLQLACRRN